MLEVRCPHCGKKLAEGLVGLLLIWCRGCRVIVRIDTRDRVGVT